MTLAAKPPLGESTPKPAALESTTKTLAAEPRARPLAPEVSPKAAAVELTATAEVQSVPAVTVTGCLAVDDETFWLKDPSGADAPKSRSWKSGFLKKRAAAIEVVDGARSLRLASYVGQRVAATGVLVDREMRARSLRPIAGSCPTQPHGVCERPLSGRRAQEVSAIEQWVAAQRSPATFPNNPRSAPVRTETLGC
jgi:hypothetical protein